MNSYEVQACNCLNINNPGTIQGHGTLIAFDTRGMIHAAATNTEQFGLPGHNTLINAPLEAALPTRSADSILDAIASQQFRKLNAFSINIGSRDLAASVHRNDQGLFILELEADSHPTHDLITDASSIVAELAHGPDLRDGLRAACDLLQELTGFDRIMAYKFDRDYNGQVIAEAKTPEMESFLGLSYPSSDIPKPAREALANSSIRLVASASEEPVPIAPEDRAEELDLGKAALRGTAPIHVDYLRNMGINASLTLSILNAKRKLWGLVICHHNEPKPIAPSQRRAAAVVAQIISNHVMLAEGEATTAAFARSHGAARKLLDAIAEPGADPFSAIGPDKPSLFDIIDADGIAIISPNQAAAEGDVPSDNELFALREWLAHRPAEKLVFATPTLGSHFTTSGQLGTELAGLLAFQLDSERQTFAAFFRRQNLRSIRWAGDPNKTSARDAADMALHLPRDSFDPWHETIEGFALPWSEEEEAVATFVAHALRPAFDKAASHPQEAHASRPA